MSKDLIKLLVAYVAGAIVLIVFLLFVVAIPTVVNHLTRPGVHEVTSPLEESVVDDLCKKLALSAEDPLCQPGTVVYAPDFFSALRAEFRPNATTYDDVQGKLASYQYKCGSSVTSADGTSYFRCWYDFKGDRVFPVVFVFAGDGTLERLFATTGDD